MSRPTLDRAKEVLTYVASAGCFVWRVTRNNNAKAGQVAGSWNGKYRYLELDGASIAVHRLVWLFEHGEWPALHIDHIDGNPGNNLIGNLRDVSRSQNIRNQRRSHRGSAVDHLGVTKKRNRFCAVITVDGASIQVGSFATAEEASEAYKSAKAIYHGVQL